MEVKIRLRAIVKDKSNCLAMYDSNRKGDINNLETVVKAESRIVWELDDESGIKEISDIRSREKNTQIFAGKWFERSPQRFELQPPSSLQIAFEAYIIKYILVDGTEVTIDPYIRIEPPF